MTFFLCWVLFLPDKTHLAFILSAHFYACHIRRVLLIWRICSGILQRYIHASIVCLKSIYNLVSLWVVWAFNATTALSMTKIIIFKLYPHLENINHFKIHFTIISFAPNWNLLMRKILVHLKSMEIHFTHHLTLYSLSSKVTTTSVILHFYLPKDVRGEESIAV